MVAVCSDKLSRQSSQYISKTCSSHLRLIRHLTLTYNWQTQSCWISQYHMVWICIHICIDCRTNVCNKPAFNVQNVMPCAPTILSFVHIYIGIQCWHSITAAGSETLPQYRAIAGFVDSLSISQLNSKLLHTDAGSSKVLSPCVLHQGMHLPSHYQQLHSKQRWEML